MHVEVLQIGQTMITTEVIRVASLANHNRVHNFGCKLGVFDRNQQHKDRRIDEIKHVDAD